MAIIEIKKEFCKNCNVCVEVCPLDVLKESNDLTPLIAYREDCQSCYLCKISCPEGAIVINPERARLTPLPF
jgi:NAD-dependent dihydropyrimidine dehydrogenase PreA subunit